MKQGTRRLTKPSTDGQKFSTFNNLSLIARGDDIIVAKKSTIGLTIVVLTNLIASVLIAGNSDAVGPP